MIANAAPPTPTQVANIQALMIHRTVAAAAAAVGITEPAFRKSVRSCVRRAVNVR